MKLISFLLVSLPLTVLGETPLDSSNARELILTVSELTEEGSTLAKRVEKDNRAQKPCAQTSDSSSPKDSPPEELKRSPIDGSDELPSSIRSFYSMEFFNSDGAYLGTHSVSAGRSYVRDVVKTASRLSGMRTEIFLRQPKERLKTIFLEHMFGVGTYGHAQIEQVENLMLVLEMSQVSDPTESFKLAKAALKDAPVERKVSFLATYLKNLEGNYELSAINGGATEGEERWDEDLHLALSKSIRTGRKIDAGVCRHMHQMAVRLAREIGFPTAFGVGFRTHGGGHRTMVLTHPDDPTKVIQLNYGRVMTNEGVSGPAALGQNGTIPDTGIRFRITNGNDELAMILPSELGGVLNHVTGGEDSDLGQRYETQSQIQQTGIKTPYGVVRVFSAENVRGNEAKTKGISYNTRIQFGPHFYGEYGAALFETERMTQRGELGVSGVYLRATHGADVKIYESPKLVLRAFGEAHVRQSIAKSVISRQGVVSKNDEFNGDLNMDAQVGVAADYNLGGVWNRTSLITQGFLDMTSSVMDEREPSAGLSTTTLDHDSYFSFSREMRGRLGFGLSLYSLGQGNYGTYNSDAQFSHSGFGTSVGVSTEGRLTADTPFWLPHAEHRGSIRLNQHLYEGRYNIGLEGQRSFEVEDSYYIGLSVGGVLGGE